MSELDKYVDENSSFITLKAGESFVAEYKGFEMATNSFDPDKKIPMYIMLPEGQAKDKWWKTQSIKVAQVIKDIQPGAKIKVTREGEGVKTRYGIEVLT